MFFNTLSGRFLGLTIIFVMIAEVLIFVPSVARFRVDNLQNRLELAQLAALAKLATPPDEDVAPDLEQELLATADVINVVLRRDGARELVLAGPMPAGPVVSYDLRGASGMQLMRSALRVYASPQGRVIRVVGQAEFGVGSEIEITMQEGPLREAMVAYGLRILYLSLGISIALATLLFLAVRYYIVQPMSRVVAHMTAYREAPEDATRIIAPESSVRELRAAETALQDLQLRLTGALRQKERLAALGGAVAKISHDLRNLLTTAQLLADRIETSADPAVRRTAPKLVASLSRAVTLCERTLTYGRAEEPAPEIAAFPLRPLVEEVIDNEAAAVEGRVVIGCDIPTGLEVRGDPDQIFRVLTNLVRNAVQAIEGVRQVRQGSFGRVRAAPQEAAARPADAPPPGRIDVTAEREGERIVIRVCDTGPGLPPKARENLFRPFHGGARQGGSGLGLVIAAELMKGHGGSVTLERTGPGGTIFRVELPVRAAG